MIVDYLGCSCEMLQAFLTETEDCALHPSLICAMVLVLPLLALINRQVQTV